MGAAAIGVAQEEDEEQGIDQQDIFRVSCHFPKRSSIIASAVQWLPLFPCLCCQYPCIKALPLLRISQEVCARRSPSAGGKRDFRAQTYVWATSWCQAGYERPRCH